MWLLHVAVVVCAATIVNAQSPRRGTTSERNQSNCLLFAACDVDIVFLLDSSTSVTDGYSAQIRFIENIADLLNIGPFEHRVALVAYAGLNKKVNVIISHWLHSCTFQVRRYDFTEFNSSAEFLSTVRTLRQISGTTYTGRALCMCLFTIENLSTLPL